MRRQTAPVALTLAIGLSGGMAQAELSAAEIWSDWQDYMTGLGYQLSGQTSLTGDVLRIEDVTFKVEFPEDDGAMTMAYGVITMTEEPDGSVRIDVDETIPLAFDLAPEGGEAVSGIVNISQKVPSLVATGSPEDVTYSYSAEQVEIVLDSLLVDREALDEGAVAFSVSIDDVMQTSNVTGEALRTLTQTLDASAVRYAIRLNDPNEPAVMTLNATVEGLSFSGDSVMPADVSMDNMAAFVGAGFSLTGAYSTGASSSAVSLEGDDGAGTFNSSSEGGNFTIAMSDKGMRFEGGQKNMSVNAVFEDLPVPVSFLAESSFFSMLLPTLKGPDAQDFGLALSLENFSMADTIWGLFDPTGALPRDPATLTIDLSGTAKLLFDWLDPAQAAVLERLDQAPGELETLTLETLVVDAAGARLSGDGAFSFDNGDTTTFDGMPRPEGSVRFTIDGAGTLLDNLVSSGLLPEQDAMGARMMMGLFARPGDGPDQLVSEIEVTGDGQVLANGQRIR